MLAREVNTASANKYIRYIKVMFDRTNKDQQLNLLPIFDKATMRGEKYGQRLAYDPGFVQKRILANSALDELNEEARRIVYVWLRPGCALQRSRTSPRTRSTLTATFPISRSCPKIAR